MLKFRGKEDNFYLQVRTAEKGDESEGRLNCSVGLEFDRSL